MVSWAVTGATRGIGFGFIEKLSSNSNDQVIALIRSRATAGPLEELASKRKNIHIIETDIGDPQKLEQAAAEAGKVTNGSLDILILNAGSTTGPETSQLTPSAFKGQEHLLEKEINDNLKANVYSNIYTTNAFLDLLRNGKEKKVAFVSSQSGNVEFTRRTGFSTLLGYSISKVAMEMTMTKFGIELAKDDIKTVSVSPGWVNTDAAKSVTGDPEVRKYVLSMFHKVDPNVQGPIEVEESVSCMLEVVRKLTAENSGKVESHREDGSWF